MIQTNRLRGVTFALVTVAATAAPLLMSAPAQAAQTPGLMPLESSGCNSNVCMELTGNAGTSATVVAWAKSTTFTGKLTITGPSGFKTRQAKSVSGTWRGQKVNTMTWNIVSPAPRSGPDYCVTGTTSAGRGEGTPCEALT